MEQYPFMFVAKIEILLGVFYDRFIYGLSSLLKHYIIVLCCLNFLIDALTRIQTNVAVIWLWKTSVFEERWIEVIILNLL